MKRLLRMFFAGAMLVSALMVSGSAFGFQAKTAKAAPTTAPSDKEIADAKAKGLVWVNTNTKVYHKDGELFGKTKHGKFMPEADAQKAGYRAAKEPKATDTKK